MSTPQPFAGLSLVSLALIGIRGAALALSLGGQTKAATALGTLADAAEAGKNIDDHMALVADKLRARASTDADWQEVADAVEADLGRLNAPG